MVIRTGSRSARMLPWLRLLALLPISLFAGHEAVFGVQYGLGAAFGQAMSAGGHDGYWAAFSLVIMALTGGYVAREAFRATRLRHRLRAAQPPRHAGAGTDARPDVGTWRREFVSIWPRLLAATAVAFLLQENLEHIAAGQAPHGLGSLIGNEHPLAVPVLAIVSAIVAAAGALIRWRVRILEQRVARAIQLAKRFRPPRATAPSREWPAVGALRAHAWFLVRLDAGRAPPALV